MLRNLLHGVEARSGSKLYLIEEIKFSLKMDTMKRI